MATATRGEGAERAERVSAVHAAAALSFAAACVHGSVMVTHFREYVLFGLFFAIVTPLQIAWALLVRSRPDHPGLLIAGGVGNLSIAFVWLVSRTVGLPFGPERLQAEAIGVKDLLATWDELVIATLVLILITHVLPRGAPRWLVLGAWGLAGVSVLAALVAGNGH